MSLLKKIHPEQPLKELRWFDIGIVTLIMFGQFIVRSTQMYLASLSPSLSTAISETSTNTASEGAAYSSNFTLQIILLALAIIYLWIRHFDFKQLPIRLKWSVLFWVPLIFAIMGLFADMVSTLSGQYNYFSPQVLAFISPMAVIDKFMELLSGEALSSIDAVEPYVTDKEVVLDFNHPLAGKELTFDVEIKAIPNPFKTCGNSSLDA